MDCLDQLSEDPLLILADVAEDEEQQSNTPCDAAAKLQAFVESNKRDCDDIMECSLGV